MDNAGSTLVRWGTAGWSVILELFIWFVFYDLVGSAVLKHGFSLFNGAFQASLPDPGVLVALAVAGGVPLGYLLYQVYYFFFWTGYLSKKAPAEARLVQKLIDCPRFHGLRNPELDDVFDSWTRLITRSRRFTGGEEGRRRWWVWALHKTGRKPERVIEFRDEWSLLHNCWFWALGQSQDDPAAERSAGGLRGRAQIGPGIGEALQRFNQLSYRYDGLGAIIIGHWWAGLLLLLYNLWRFVWLRADYPDWRWLVFFLVFTGLEGVFFLTFYRIIWVNRIHIRASLVALADSFICHFTCAATDSCHRRGAPAPEER